MSSVIKEHCRRDPRNRPHAQHGLSPWTGRHLAVLNGSTTMTVVEDPQPGSRGSMRIPSADDVLIAAIGLVLAGAGLTEAATFPNGHAAGTGFVAARVVGAAHPRVTVTWYEDGKATDGPDGPAGKLHDCERALRRAGFHVEYTAANTVGYLLAWQSGRSTAYLSRALRRR